jgi:pimeloyl-ACP methyl ester carboxylesterase
VTFLTIFALAVGFTAIIIGGLALNKENNTVNPNPNPNNVNPNPSPAGPYSATEPNEDLFTWLNKAEVGAGKTTCGFLKSPLATWPTDEPYPKVNVYFCMTFAKSQPAKFGTIITHCGGPGSLSGCANVAYPKELGPDVMENYNVVGVDQRGLGRSLPSFMNENCSNYGPGDVLTAVELAKAETTAALGEEFAIVASLRQKEFQVASCWKHPEFMLPAADGSAKTYHFLQYSGTQALVRDIDLFRQAIGANKVSLFGTSYGTQIAGSYATVFPEHTDKLVLDSTVAPIADMREFATVAAEGTNSLWNYLAFSCTIMNSMIPGDCPVDDAGRVVRTVMKKIADLYPSGKTDFILPSYFANFFVGGGQAPDLAAVREVLEGITPVYEAAVSGTDEDFVEQLHNATEKKQATMQPGRRTQLDPDTYSQPTVQNNVAGIPNYATYAQSDVAQSCILGQSMTNHAYDEEQFMAVWRNTATLEPALGTYKAANQLAGWWSMTYFWPKSNPIATIGSPLQKGIIVGFVFDPNTPYKWAQQMRAAMPSMALVTSQDQRHGIDPTNVYQESSTTIKTGVCYDHIRSYFLTGQLPENGVTCGAPLPAVTAGLAERIHADTK